MSLVWKPVVAAVALLLAASLAGSAHAATQVYMSSCCGTGASVSFLDGMMFMEDGFLPGARGTTAIAISPDGMTAYLGLSPSGQGGTIQVVDLMMRMVERSFPAGNNPAALAITPDGATGIAANRRDGSATVFATATGAVTATLPIAPGGACLDAGVSPDGVHGYVVCQAPNGGSFVTTMAILTIQDPAVQQVVALPGTQSFPGSNLLAITPDGSRAYVAGVTTDTQTGYAIVDLATGTLMKFVPLSRPSYGLMVDLLDTSALISSGDGTVDVLHANNGQVMISVPIFASGKGGLAPLMGGMRVAIADIDDDMVTVVDNTDGHAIAVIPTGGRPSRVVVSSDEMSTVVGGTSSTLVTALDAARGNPLLSFEAGTAPGPIASSPDGATAYVLDAGVSGSGGGVMAVSNATGARVGAVPIASPSGLAISTDGSNLYVGSADAGISVVSTATMAVTSIVSLGSMMGACAVAITPDGSTLYAAYTQAAGSNVLSAIATASGTLTGTVVLGSNPANLSPALAISPDGRRAYVTDPSSGKVAVVDLSNQRLLASVTLGSGLAPVGIAIDPAGKTAYLASSQGFQGVGVFDLASNRLSKTIPISGGARSVAFTPDGSLAYVAVAHGHAAVISTDSQQVVKRLSVSNTSNVAIAVTP